MGVCGVHRPVRVPPPTSQTGERPWEGTSQMAGNGAGAAAGGGALYGLGIFGAWVYFFQQADSVGSYLLAVVQGLFWPAWMVYEAFRAFGA